jgi:hypothetical protein
MTGDLTTSNSLIDLRERAKAEHAAVRAPRRGLALGCGPRAHARRVGELDVVLLR